MENAADREAAWDAVHEALPARWRVAADPSNEEPPRGAWSVTAVGPHPGRGKMARSVTGSGEDEAAALRNLNAKLRGVAQPDGSRVDELRRGLRLAYVQGAEEWTREHVGRGLSKEELAGVLRRYPGDLPQASFP